MNILILFSQPWRVGGAETHVEALLKGLEEHKIFLAVGLIMLYNIFFFVKSSKGASIIFRYTKYKNFLQ